MSHLGLPEVVGEISRSTGITQDVVGRVLKSFFTQIESTRFMDEPPSIKIKGFGKFWFVRSAERAGKNPGTGESMTIPPTWRLRFSPSKSLLKRVKDKRSPEVVVTKRRSRATPP